MDESGSFGAFLLTVPFVLILIAWLIVAGVAAWVAPEGRRLTFFLITLFFLGPIGIAAAAIAQPRPAASRPVSAAPIQARQQPVIPTAPPREFEDTFEGRFMRRMHGLGEESDHQSGDK